VLLTSRKRRRILKVVLPLLIIVWAAMPGLPCCQAAAASEPQQHSGLETVHAGHSAAARTSHSGVDHGNDHGDHEAGPEDNIAAPDLQVQDGDSDSSGADCPDVDKNHHEVRSISTIDLPHTAPIFFLPVATVLAGIADPLGEPPPPVQRRPLHLSKSVLLI
jgi:hypothetical protein